MELDTLYTLCSELEGYSFRTVVGCQNPLGRCRAGLDEPGHGGRVNCVTLIPAVSTKSKGNAAWC